MIALQDQMREAIGRPKVEVPLYQPDPEVAEWTRRWVEPKLAGAVKNPDKLAREDAIERLREQVVEAFLAEHGEDAAAQVKDVEAVFDQLLKDFVRKTITEDGERVDGRALDEIRPISCEVGLLPRVHGSGLFTRGQTQVLSAVALGLKSDEQLLDDLREEDRKRYIHHYNFPGFSVGEVRPMRSPGRREIGHGALAERALLPVIPPEEEFPYTIRVVSEVLSSNGSTVPGQRLRLHPGSDGCGRAHPQAGGWHRHGPGQVRRPLCHPDATSRASRTPWATWTSRSPAPGMASPPCRWTSRSRGDQPGDPGRRPWNRPARAGCTSWIRCWKSSTEPRPELSPYAPRIITMPDPRRQDPRRHRAGRQDDQQDHRGDGRPDRHRGRRHASTSPPSTRRRASGPGDDREPGQGRGGRGDLHRQGEADHELRRLRGDPARQGRAGPHLQAGAASGSPGWRTWSTSATRSP